MSLSINRLINRKISWTIHQLLHAAHYLFNEHVRLNKRKRNTVYCPRYIQSKSTINGIEH